MDIHIRRGNRAGKPFLTSMEDKSLVQEGEEFHTQYESDLTTGYDCTCLKATYDAIVDKVGTLEAPALIADANAQPIAGRINTYIENGSLKILAQS